MASTAAPASRFDDEAKNWDSNPTTVESSRKFFEAICQRFPSLADGKEKDKRALEIGCGTGLLTTHVAPLLGEYVAFDPSQGMIDVLKTKLGSMPQVKPVAELLEDPNTPHLGGKPVDYAFSHLTLHHIPDMLTSIRCLSNTLSPGGYLILSDFEATSTSEKFHPKAKHHDVERHGVAGKEIEQMLKEVGLNDVKVEHSFDLPKGTEDEGGKEVMFPFLIAVGRK